MIRAALFVEIFFFANFYFLFVCSSEPKAEFTAKMRNFETSSSVCFTTEFGVSKIEVVSWEISVDLFFP